ncbi:MAG: class I SAM-dependent methyltransferase [Candidatus Woesearchaeota archaeon]
MNSKKPLKLRDALHPHLTTSEREFLTTSFDIVGTIAVIEVRDELRHKEKLIGETLLSSHKNITTVCRRHGEHSGIYRTQKLRIIAGKRTKETIHKESGCALKLHVEKCYFSARSGSERLRIVSLINKTFAETKKKEDILVMFSGIAPFVCVIGKNAVYKTLTGIELNKIAHKYAQENCEKNKIKNVQLYNADVRVHLKNYTQKFHRIIMPLPRSAEQFLDCALLRLHTGGYVHLYGFLAEDEFEGYKRQIKTIAESLGFNVNILQLVKCGQFSPRIFRICVDFQIREKKSKNLKK